MVEASSSSNGNTPPSIPTEEEEQLIDDTLIPWDFIDGEGERGEGLRSTSDRLVDLFLGSGGADGRPQQDSVFLDGAGSTSISSRAATTSPIEFPFPSNDNAQLCVEYGTQPPQIDNDSAVGLGADDFVADCSLEPAPTSCGSFSDTLLRQALMADAAECGENDNENVGRSEDASMIASQVFSDFANDVLPESTPDNGDDTIETMSRVATPSPPPYPVPTTGNNIKTLASAPPPPTMPHVGQNSRSKRGTSASRLPKRRGSYNTATSRKNTSADKTKKGSTRKTNSKKVTASQHPPPPPPVRPDVALSSSAPPPPPSRPDTISSSSVPLTPPTAEAAKAARLKRMEKLASRNIGIAAPSRRSRLQREQMTAEVVRDAAKGLEKGLKNEDVARVAHELLLDVQLNHAGVSTTNSNVDASILRSLSFEVEKGRPSSVESATAAPVHSSNVAPQPRKAATVGNPVTQASSGPFLPQSVCSSQTNLPPPVPVVFATTEKKTQRTTMSTKKKVATTTAKRQPAKAKTPPARKKRKTKGGNTETAAVVPVKKPTNTKKSTTTTSLKKKSGPAPVKAEDLPAQKNETKKKKEGPKTHINGVPLPVGNDPESRRQRRLIRNRMSAQLHRERKREAIENYQKQVEERDLEIEDLKNELMEVKSRNTTLEEMISKLRSKLGEEVLNGMIMDDNDTVKSPATSQALSPSSPPHLVNESDHSTVAPPSPYADRSSTSGEDTDALSTVPSSPVSCSSPLHQQGIGTPSQLALPLISNSGKRSREAADCTPEENQLPPAVKIPPGRGRKKKARVSSTSLMTLSSVAICGVLGCIALVTSPGAVKLSIFTPSWGARDTASRGGEMGDTIYDDKSHRRLSVNIDTEPTVDSEPSLDGISSSVKVSKALLPATRSWVISPLELHPEKWTIHRNRPWTVQNSYVLFDKPVVNSVVPAETYQEAFRQQLCRALLTTEVLYPSTMGTMAILCSPMANRMLELPSPLPEAGSNSIEEVSTPKSPPKPIVNINKDEKQSSSMKPSRLRGAASVEAVAPHQEKSPEDTDELLIFDQTENDSESNVANSLYSVASLSSRPFLYPSGGQHLQNHQKVFGADRDNKNDVNSAQGPDQSAKAGQNSTSFLFCPSAYASVSPDFLDLIGKGVSVFDTKSKNSDWNSRDENGRLDGVFNDIDLDFADFDDDGNEPEGMFDTYIKGSAADEGIPLIGEVNTDVVIEDVHEDQPTTSQNMDIKYPQNNDEFAANYIDDTHPQIWVHESRGNERDEDNKALVPTFGERGIPYDLQRPLFTDKRVARTSFVGDPNEQYPNMVILVPLSAVHGNGSGVFREYEDIPAAEQPWIELDCSVTSARIVDGIEFVSDDTIREDYIRPNSK